MKYPENVYTPTLSLNLELKRCHWVISYSNGLQTQNNGRSSYRGRRSNSVREESSISTITTHAKSSESFSCSLTDHHKEAKQSSPTPAQSHPADEPMKFKQILDLPSNNLEGSLLFFSTVFCSYEISLSFPLVACCACSANLFKTFKINTVFPLVLLILLPSGCLRSARE